jgi:hypothetical protein
MTVMITPGDLSMNRRFGVGAAVGAVLVLSLTGCLGESKSGGSGSAGGAVQLTAAQVLQKASQQTSQATSYTVRLTAKGTELGQSFSARGISRHQATPPATHESLQIKIGGRTLPGGEQWIFVDDVLYLKMPALSQMYGGKAWFKFSKKDMKKNLGMNLRDLRRQTEQFNPQLMTKMFTVSKDAKAIGAETVEGVQTTRYTGTFRAKEALSKLTSEEREVAKDLFDTGGEKMSFNLWIDAQRLPRKLAMKSLPGAKDKASLTMVFRDYGKPMNITAPPADQVGRPPKALLAG